MKDLKTYMLNVGLTNEQLKAKKTYIGGSSAKDLAEGRWDKLYNRIIHDKGEDLSKIFKVQLGHITEEFNLTWFADMMDFDLPDKITTKALRHPTYPYIGCLPDAIMTKENGRKVVIDAKHTTAKAPWWNEQKLAEYYFPQAQHNMLATGIHSFYLSVIFGNEGPVAIEIPYDAKWSMKYLGFCRTFWKHIKSKTPPVDINAELAIPKIALDDMRELDMTKGNMAVDWGNAAHIIITDKEAHTRWDDAKKEIKELVPDDVKRAYGNGVEITRNKKGSMTVKTKEKDNV